MGQRERRVVTLDESQSGSRFRTTSEGRVYHHSRGANGADYAICLACGRAEPQTLEGELPEIFTRAQGHYKLRARKADRLCPGSSNRWAITRVALGHESRTDMLEIQLRKINGQALNDYSTALTLAVALRDALAELLGVQAAELGCDAREVRSGEGARCHSIFIFDRYAAGYASGAGNFVNQLFQKAAEILTCPKRCDSSCPNCILDFDQRFEASTLDRHAALTFLNPTWLNALKLPQELCFLWNVVTSRDFDSCRCSSARERCSRCECHTLICGWHRSGFRNIRGPKACL